MFIELVKFQNKRNQAPESVAAAKRSWRRQRRVQKILTRAIV